MGGVSGWVGKPILVLSFSSSLTIQKDELYFGLFNDKDHHGILGIIISGGVRAEKSVEIYYGVGLSKVCRIASLPDSRVGHTMNGLVICGGLHTPDNCISFSKGKWTFTHILKKGRISHTSWVTKVGTFLIGGIMDNNVDSANTSELITQPVDNDDSGLYPLQDFSMYYEKYCMLCIHTFHLGMPALYLTP